MGDSLQTDSLLDHLLEELHQLRLILSGRLSSLETSVCFLNNTCSGMVGKLESVEGLMQRTHDVLQASETVISQSAGTSRCGSADGSNTGASKSGGVLATAAGVMKLPGVEDYPEGTWLGDPDSPSKRVRSPITPQNLLHINSTCVTAEKMALTLLDYLFSRDELANSNISGRSRNNKKQLDPMMVYGIRCHLQYKFSITAKEWNRICQNMDSKCRSAWKRKLKNLGLSTDQPQTKLLKVCHAPRAKDNPLPDDISFDFEQLQPSSLDLSCVKVMSASPCELRILHSTSANLDSLPETHEIVLAEDRILTAAVNEKENTSILMSSRGTSGRLSMTPCVMSSDSLVLPGVPNSSLAVCSQHNTMAGPTRVHQATLSVQQSTLPRCTVRCSLPTSPQQCSVQCSVSGNLQQCSVTDDLQQCPVSDDLQQCSVSDDLQQCSVPDDLQQCSVTDDLQQCPVSDDLQQCSVSLSCSSLSLGECTVDDQRVLSAQPMDGAEGVIVISRDSASDDHDGILEIGVDETLPHMQDTDSPSPPPTYKLLPQTHSSFHSSLQLPSSSIKHEIDGQDISDDLDESMQSIHQSSLHHLTMNSLGVIRVKDDMDLKGLKVQSSLDD